MKISTHRCDAKKGAITYLSNYMQKYSRLLYLCCMSKHNTYMCPLAPRHFWPQTKPDRETLPVLDISGRKH